MSHFQEVVFSPLGSGDDNALDSIQQGHLILSLANEHVSHSPLDSNSNHDDVSTRPHHRHNDAICDDRNRNLPQSEDNEQLEPGNSTTLGASMNFINSIVGAGIIGIPLAIQQCGFVLGMFLLALVAYLVKQSVVMMIDCGIRAKKFNLEDLAESLLGPIGYYLAIVPMFLFAYGGQIAYLVIVGDTVPLVANYISPSGESIFHNREVVVTLFSIIIILPLCLLRDLSHLAWTSSLSIISDVILIVVILFASIPASKEQADHFESQDLSELNTRLFAGVGTMSFAFVCQHNSFLVFRSLKTPTLKAWNSVASLSIIVSYTLSLTLGLIGFFAFYPFVQGDLLNNFPSSYASVCIARALLASTMIFTYPMECYVSRHCLYSLSIRNFGSKSGDLSAASIHSNRRLLSSDSSHHADEESVHERNKVDHNDGNYEMVKKFRNRPSDIGESEESDEEEEVVFNHVGGNAKTGGDGFDMSHLSEVDLADALHHHEDSSNHNHKSHHDNQPKPSNLQKETHHVQEGFTKFWHLTCTLLLWGSTLMIALVAKKLGVVSALTG